MSWDWALCQGAGGCSQQTAPGPTGPLRDPQLQLLQPHKGTAPPLLLPVSEDAVCLELHSLTPPVLPTAPLAQSHRLSMYM